MKLASGFCIPEPLPVHTGIKGRQVHPLIRFLLRSRVDEKSADLHKAVHLCFVCFDFALRATKVTARSLGKAMSTMVVQERHLWLNLVEMKDVDKARFLDAPISQAGLFGDTVEGFAQQFSAVQQQTEAIQHTCPGVMHHPPLPPGPGLSLPVAVGALLRPTELLRPKPNLYLCRRLEPLAGARRPPRPSQAPGRPGSRRSGPDAGNPEMLELALSQETARAAPLLSLVEGREENLPFLFQGPAVPIFSRKSNFLFLRVLRSMGRQCATPCFLTLAHVGSRGPRP